MPFAEWIKYFFATAASVAAGVWFLSGEIHDSASSVRTELSGKIESVRLELSGKIDAVEKVVANNGAIVANIQGQLASEMRSPRFISGTPRQTGNLSDNINRAIGGTTEWMVHDGWYFGDTELWQDPDGDIWIVDGPNRIRKCSIDGERAGCVTIRLFDVEGEAGEGTEE